MKLAVNSCKGTVIKHPELGELPAQVAKPINDEDSLLAEAIEGVVVINEIVNDNGESINIKEIIGNKK